VDNADWGNISDWKNKYNNAIGNLLAGHESEHALAAL
jgi:phosphoribosylformylglycinamidine synthase